MFKLSKIIQLSMWIVYKKNGKALRVSWFLPISIIIRTATKKYDSYE